MRHRLLFTLTMFVVLTGASQAQTDGTKRCHNFVKNGEKANCICWGNANPGNKKYPNCPHQGEDPKCTNHCKKDMCDCKSPCQS